MSRALPVGVEASQGQAAGLVSRTVADVVDVAVVSFTLILGYLGVSALRLVLRPRLFRWPEPGTLDLAVVGAVVFVAYLAVGWTTTGRTIGKQVMGLRAVRADGSRLRLGRGLVRALVCVLFPFGLLWSAVDRRERALHDVLLGTSVVYDWRRRLVREPALVR